MKVLLSFSLALVGAPAFAQDENTWSAMQRGVYLFRSR